MKHLVLKIVQWAIRHYVVSTEEITNAMATAIVSNKPIRRWIKEDGVIRFTKPFVANGWTVQQWKDWFGDNRTDWADQLLDSPDFQPTPAGTRVNLAILLGELFTDSERTTQNIRAKEAQLKFVNPNPDAVLLLIKNFSVEEIREMGLLWLIGMDNPIEDSVGGPGLLGVDADSGVLWLSAYGGNPGNEWHRESGCVVAVPQV